MGKDVLGGGVVVVGRGSVVVGRVVLGGGVVVVGVGGSSQGQWYWLHGQML